MRASLKLLLIARVLFCVLGFTPAVPAPAQIYKTVYNFSTTTTSPATNLEGIGPSGGLTASGNTFYGATQFGGSNGYGGVFTVNADGSGFTNLYSFKNSADGRTPNGQLVLLGATLYGTTQGGGGHGNGTIFKVATNGAGFAILYTFSATAGPSYTNSDGAMPAGGLASIGGNLVGVAESGGAAGSGTFFEITTNGGVGGFQVLHTFSGVQGLDTTNGDGAAPIATPSAGVGALIAGTTFFGGASGFGTVFSYNTNTALFGTIYSFTNGGDGAYPTGGTLAAGIFYGTTQGDGNVGNGTVFRINNRGQNFTNLHTFNTNEVLNPVAGLILSGSTLYGTTFDGGTNGTGGIFSLNTDGTGFTNLLDFTGLSGPIPTNGDGATPAAMLALSGSTLYGEAAYGGTSGGGTLFKVNTDGTGFTNLHNFNAPPSVARNADGADPQAGLVVSEGMSYGTTEQGGTSGIGTIFKVRADGTGLPISMISHRSPRVMAVTPWAVCYYQATPCTARPLAGGNSVEEWFSKSTPMAPGSRRCIISRAATAEIQRLDWCWDRTPCMELPSMVGMRLATARFSRSTPTAPVLGSSTFFQPKRMA